MKWNVKAGLWKKYFAIAILQFVFVANSFCGNDTMPHPREFRGHLPNIRDLMRIQFSQQNDTLLAAAVQFEGHAKVMPFEGKLDTGQYFLVFELDEYGLRKNIIIKGQMLDTVLKGSYITGRDQKEFLFVEIDISKPPPFKSEKKDTASVSFADYVYSFQDRYLPDTMGFKKEGKQIVDLIGFMDKPVRKVATDEAPVFLIDRANAIKNITAGGKVVFDGDIVGLLIQTYCNVWVDGPLFSTYMYLYNQQGEFVDAFVVYESADLIDIRVTATLSRSKIFLITYNAMEETEFSVDTDGTIKFREH